MKHEGGGPWGNHGFPHVRADSPRGPLARVWGKSEEGYSAGMPALQVAAECAQCGRVAPDHAEELAHWRHGDLVLEGDLDDVMAGMVVCPECDAAGLDFDQGDPG